MAITFRSATTRAGDVNGGSTTGARPAGLAAGDVLVAVVARSQTASGVSSFSSSGWTVAGFFAGSSSLPPMAVLWRVATAADVTATSWTFTSNGFSGNDQFNLHILAFDGVDTANPIAVAPVRTDASAAASTAVAPSVTIPAGLPDSAWMVSAWAGLYYFATENSYTWNAPATMTRRSDQGGSWLHFAVATEPRAAGATGTRTGTFVRRSTNAAQAVNNGPRALSFALRPENTGIQAVGAIPTGEAFGRPTIAPGGVELGAAGGIASAEGVGSPSIAPGQEFGPAGGIASAEALGAPALTPGLATVGPATGIPSATAVGTPRLVPGTVTLPSVGGIPTGEAFGDHTVQFGFAEVDLPKAYPRTTIPYPAVQYELVCVARVPQTNTPPLLLEVDPIDWTGLSLTDELSKPQKLDASCQVSKLTEPIIQRLRNLSELATELWLYRNGKQVFAGPLYGWSVSGETLTLNSLGLLSYLRLMVIADDMVFNQVDQNFMVRDMIDQWQELEYGHFGIHTDDIAASGQLRDGTYLQKELHNVGQRVEDLGKRNNGFDITVDPASRKVQLWTPQQGIDRSTGEDAIVFDVRNVTSTNVLCSAAPGDVASEAFGTGSASGSDSAVYSVRSNLELRAQYGRSAVAATFEGVSEQSTCDDYTQALVDARGVALLIPGPDVRTTTDADPASYDVGDTVAYQLHERLGVGGAFRVRRRTVTVSDVGREKTAVEFV